MGIFDPIERKISEDRICTVLFVHGDAEISILDDERKIIDTYGYCITDETEVVNFSKLLNDFIYHFTECEELTDEDKEEIKDTFDEAGNRFIKDLTSLIEVGDTYCDPQGEYEIIVIDGEYLTLKCIDEVVPGSNIGQEYSGIPISEAVFYIYGYYKDDSGIKYIPDSERI